MRRSTPVLLAAPLFAGLGCTQLLGVDEDYVVAPGSVSSSGTSGATGATAGVGGGGSGGLGGSGGSVPDGAAGSSHAGVGGDAGAPADSGAGGNTDVGPVDAAPGDVCVPSLFEGTFAGEHAPSTPIPFFPFPLTKRRVSGTVALTFNRFADGVLTVTVGRLQGLFDASSASFAADLSGSLDCSSGHFQGAVVDGRSDPVGPGFDGFAFGGSIEGNVVVDGAKVTFTGVWDEAEIPPVTGAVGSGSWMAQRQ